MLLQQSAVFTFFGLLQKISVTLLLILFITSWIIIYSSEPFGVNWKVLLALRYLPICTHLNVGEQPRGKDIVSKGGDRVERSPWRLEFSVGTGGETGVESGGIRVAWSQLLLGSWCQLALASDLDAYSQVCLSAS